MEAARRRIILLIVLNCISRMTVEGDHSPEKKPHIILIMADDLGWNDVSYHGSDQIPTPNLDSLAYDGVILNNHYSQALCTPSRSALMTGRYPIHTGMQHRVILPSEPWGLPLSERLLSQDLKSLGYATHIVGKWHLGFHRKEYTPLYRGFDSHYGFWSGYQDYYTHQAQGTTVLEYFWNQLFPILNIEPYQGLDMRRGLQVDSATIGLYSTDLFTDEATSIISAHGGNPENSQTPLFLYVAFSAPHAGNSDDPLQAPGESIDKFPYIADPERRKYAAMVSKLDEAVGKLVESLEDAGMLEDSIIAFLSDNGGQTEGINMNKGSNYPLKGEKISPWEGGVKTNAFVWSPRIKSPGRISNQLMHISDWMPTLFSAAGGDQQVLRAASRPRLDGFDMSGVIFDAIVTDTPTRPPPHEYQPRSEVLINIDDLDGYAAIRVKDFKLVDGTTAFGMQDHWVGDSGRNDIGIPAYSVSTLTASMAGQALQRLSPTALEEGNVLRLRGLATVDCDSLWPPKDYAVPKIFPPCLPLLKACLFDVAHDPCEMRNLCLTLPGVAVSLRKRLEKLRFTAVPPNNRKSDPRADPKCWKGVWTNWNDYPSNHCYFG